MLAIQWTSYPGCARLPKDLFENFWTFWTLWIKFCDRKRDEHITTYKPNKVRDITDALLKAVMETSEVDKLGVGLTDEHILMTAQELIGAGFDTVATTLEWAILFLATNDGFQKLAHQVIESSYWKEKGPVRSGYGLFAHYRSNHL